jgi:hypothetical protein
MSEKGARGGASRVRRDDIGPSDFPRVVVKVREEVASMTGHESPG